MKKFNVMLFAASAVIMASCGGAEEKVEEVVEPVTYKLDKEASTLTWTGMKNMGDDKHSGTIKFAEGTVETLGDVLTSGSLTVDMNSLATTDQLPEELAGKLNDHLKDADFFDVAKYPSATVTVGEYKDGKLPTTIKLMDMEFKNDVPVKVTMKDDKVMIAGSFDFDFGGIKSVGFMKDPKSGEQIQSVFKFDLNVVMSK